MTPKEADRAAELCVPVIHNHIEYLRINQVGYSYDEKGRRSPFVQLLDKCGHSVTYADPARCELKEAANEE